MKLTDYQNEWDADTKMNMDHLDDESLRIPRLHSKWLTYFSNERLLHKKLMKKKESEMLTLADYYAGLIDGRDIGREPWAFKTETKAATQKRIENDPKVLKIQAVLDELEEIVLFIKEVVTSINFRNNTISNAIKFKQWTNGTQ